MKASSCSKYASDRASYNAGRVLPRPAILLASKKKWANADVVRDDLRRFLLEDAFRKTFLKTVRDPEVIYFWERNFPQVSGKPQASIVTRLDAFLRPKAVRYMVCQKDSRLDFAEIMDTGKIFLAKLPQGLIGQENAHLFGTLLVSKFQQTAIARQSIAAERRRDFWLYIDECHNFVTPSMGDILTGSRKYRLGLILAHQELRQLLNRDVEVGIAVLAVTAIRREYFLEVMHGKSTGYAVPMNVLPAKSAEVDGIAWLPRLIAKARIKLRGELNPDLMHGCAGDRPFLRSHHITLPQFLKLVWEKGDDDRAIVDAVKKATRR